MGFANVGELALDVLVASLAAPLAARLESANVLPVAGNDAYDAARPGTLATALELFAAAPTDGGGAGGSGRVFLLQQRAPALRGRQAAAAAEAAAWIKAAGFARVLLLCGMPAQLRGDAQLGAGGGAARVLAAGAPGRALADAAASPAGGCTPLEADFVEKARDAAPLLPPWPLLDELERAGVPAALLSVFVCEGDNGPDGLALAGAAAAVLAAIGCRLGDGAGGAPPALKPPCSWAALYGRSLQDAAPELW